MNRNMKPMVVGVGQAGGAAKRPKANVASSMLTQDENEMVFLLLGRKCQTLNTAVVQIYKTEGSAHSHWKKKYTGVVCFVKDSGIRSYFLRAYCLIKNELIWEHELYDTMQLTKARPFLLTFEGNDGHVGLNFVSEEECESFYRIVDSTIEARNRKKQEQRNRVKSQNAPGVPKGAAARPPPIGQSLHADDSVQLRKTKAPAATSFNNVPMPSTKTLTFGLNKKDIKRKVTKADISTPMHFVHLSHVGFDANKGFDWTSANEDPALTTFFEKAGVSENQLKDRETRAFIYDFIESNNVLESVKQASVESPTNAEPQHQQQQQQQQQTPPSTSNAPMVPSAPPPVPSRHHHHHQQQQQQQQLQNATQNGTLGSQRTAPPPPPARQPPPPVPTTIPGSARAPAPPSRQHHNHSAANSNSASAAAANQHASATTAFIPPPPPPPPPPSSNAGAVPPPPPPMPTSASIPKITTTQAPAEPKPPSNLPPITDTHSALMESIRKGTMLKKVDTAALSTGSGDSRSELMSEIRMGFELRPAANRELGANRNSDDGAGTDALADALRRALQERGRVIQSSDDESPSSGNDDEWDD